MRWIACNLRDHDKASPLPTGDHEPCPSATTAFSPLPTFLLQNLPTLPPTSPLSRRRISTCILEITAHSDRISTLPPVQRHILASTACQTLLARNMSIEPNIYGCVVYFDGYDKVLGDYDHDGNPINTPDATNTPEGTITANGAPAGNLAGPDCYHYEPKHFAIMPYCPTPAPTPPADKIQNYTPKEPPQPSASINLSINITHQGQHFFSQLFKSILDGLK